MQTDTAKHSTPTRSVASSTAVGEWFVYDTGPLAGRFVRVVLQEQQKANHGRKYGRKDKRPLDPPPVVRARCYQLLNQGALGHVEQELELNDEPSTFGLLCHVDLFPEPRHPGSVESQQPLPFQTNAATSTDRAQWPPLVTHSAANAPPPEGIGYSSVQSPFRDDRSVRTDRVNYAGPRTGDLPIERPPDPWNMRPRAPTVPIPNVTHESLNILRDSKCTDLLAGETVVQCSLVDYDGKKTAMFAFPDLAVKREGRFVLRYRIFDIQQKTDGSRDVKILAECFGGPFEIYSTKSFPGLQASTELTRRLSLSGIRVNSRHKERKGWKRDRRGDSAEYHSTIPRASTATRKPALVGGPGAPYAQTFSSEFSFAQPSSSSPPGFFAGGGSSRPRSPSALVAWARIGSDVVDVSMNGDSCSTGTEEEGSTHSVW